MTETTLPSFVEANATIIIPEQVRKAFLLWDFVREDLHRARDAYQATQAEAAGRLGQAGYDQAKKALTDLRMRYKYDAPKIRRYLKSQGYAIHRYTVTYVMGQDWVEAEYALNVASQVNTSAAHGYHSLFRDNVGHQTDVQKAWETLVTNLLQKELGRI